jgi:glucose/arabinose dehydrogenase
MLGVFLSPHYAKDHSVYLTYSEPGEGGASLALARARLALGEDSASLEDSRSGGLFRVTPKEQ